MKRLDEAGKSRTGQLRRPAGVNYSKQVSREVLAERVSGPMRVCCAIEHVAINLA